MGQYTPLNSENLLVECDVLREPIHYSFYDNHVLNVVENEKGEDHAGNVLEMLASMKKSFSKRLDDIKKALETISLYKYIDIDGLGYWLKDNKLYWNRVSDSWEDPYENYFLKETFVLEDGKLMGADNNIPGVFGQSWTMREETDAMWRIYSKEDGNGVVNGSKVYTGVRIKTTASKLLDVIYTSGSSMANLWIGKVKYLTEEQINKTLEGGITDIATSLAYSFFNKRVEFEHEHEFRAIKLMDSEAIGNTLQYKRIAFPIEDMDCFIDSFVLDPRLSDANFAVLEKKLESMGASPAKISKSQLYHFSPINVKVLQ